jgi:signal transduction histidine kinase
MRGEDVVGLLVVRRRAAGVFSQNTIDLIKTFAAQSAVAIENARLFQSVQTSLEDLRTAQDRLVQTQKLASLGQLTAGIAHEIKNPLNFVNNFSGVSAELIDELREALKGAPLDERIAGAGEHYHMHMRIAIGALYGGCELPRHVVVNRIENVRSVERNPRDAPITLVHNF